MITKREYDLIRRQLHNTDDVERLSRDPNFTASYAALMSIHATMYMRKILRTSSRHRSKDNIQEYLIAYKNGERIADIARRIEYAPCLLARILLAEQQLGGFNKKQISSFLKNTNLLADHPDPTMQGQIQQCVEEDEHYSPFIDKCKHAIGLEYEFRLEECLRNANIPFETEDELKAQGHPRTPDVRLLIPICIQGHKITWIDSKAMFGDEHTHQSNLHDQLGGYVSRFGPGLVIYWFGYVETLVQNPIRDRDVLVLSDFPKDFLRLTWQGMIPTFSSQSPALTDASMKGVGTGEALRVNEGTPDEKRALANLRSDMDRIRSQSASSHADLELDALLNEIQSESCALAQSPARTDTSDSKGIPSSHR